MNKMKSLFSKPFISETITIYFYDMHGNPKTIRLNQLLAFALLCIILCSSFCLAKNYFEMKKNYGAMESTYSTAVKECKRLENENTLLKNDISTIESRLQSVQGDMDEILRYKTTLEKSSFIRSILK